MEHQWTLAMETSVPQATLALACNGVISARAEFTSERSQEVDLFAPLEQILGQLPTGQTLSAIIVGTGPGSYNGARVGIASAQAIAQVHHCGVAGLCSFEGVPDLQWAVGDARRDSFFIMPVGAEPELLDHQKFLTRLDQLNGPIGTFEPLARLRLTGQPVTQVTPTAETLLQAWEKRSVDQQAALLAIPPEAYYLRPPHITVSKKKPL
ncbi:MAG: hypothetical protein ACSHYF_03860 [Verrucomicrobiaceae bacterium]